MFLLIFDYPPLFMGPGYTYFVVLFRCNTTLWYFTATFSFPVTSKSAVANGRQKNILPIWNPARWRKPLCLVLETMHLRAGHYPRKNPSIRRCFANIYRQGRYEEVSNNLSKVPREIGDGPLNGTKRKQK